MYIGLLRILQSNGLSHRRIGDLYETASREQQVIHDYDERGPVAEIKSWEVGQGFILSLPLFSMSGVNSESK